jgi:hypothetical protein
MDAAVEGKRKDAGLKPGTTKGKTERSNQWTRPESDKKKANHKLLQAAD